MLQVQQLHQYYGGSHILRGLSFEARIGEVTFWVEYREADGVADVLCAWSHRMQIIGGQS